MNLPIQAKPVSRKTTASFELTDGVNPSFCVGANVSGRKICVHLPVIGNVCVNSPVPIPVGAHASACTCSKWGIPCGAKFTVSVAGHTILSKGVGCC